jgi:HD-like signal output (HDOD) protein
MCRIAEIAHAFDELLESLPYGEVSRRDLIGELESLFPDGESAAILSQLPGRIPLQRQDISTFAERIPISQASAAELWRLIAVEDPQVRVLEALTSSDAVLACLLVRAANVAAFALRSPITSVRKAILHIGIPKARRILVAALLRPVFSSGPQKALWNHSLNAVEASETICALSGQFHSGEVFLASLVHDIGRAALLAGNNRQAELYGELIGEVAEVTAVEQLLFGMDHGAIGDAVLEGWHFPESLRSAVRNHHQPELSNDLLTPALYLVEFVTGSGEDLPSIGRLSTCARTLGVPLPDMLRCTAEPASDWKVLRYAA